MDGRRALIYSRIRENRLDPAENDLTRAERQQQVIQAIADKLVGVGTFLRLPFIGDDLVTPLATDLSAGQLLQLGWVKFRATRPRAPLPARRRPGVDRRRSRCLLLDGGEPAVISMFLGSPRRSRHRRARGRSAPGCGLGPLARSSPLVACGLLLAPVPPCPSSSPPRRTRRCARPSSSAFLRPPRP